MQCNTTTQEEPVQIGRIGRIWLAAAKTALRESAGGDGIVWMPEHFLKSSPKSPLKTASEFLDDASHPSQAVCSDWIGDLALGKGQAQLATSRCRFWMLPSELWRGLRRVECTWQRSQCFAMLKPKNLTASLGNRSLNLLSLHAPRCREGMEITLITL